MRMKILFLISLFLLTSILILSSSSVMSGGISIWPGKLTITMPEDFPEGEIRYEIEVNNLNSYDINVSAEAENPPQYRLEEDYAFMPNLSWVSIAPEILHIPAYETRFLEVIITIPDDEKPLHYDERWEVRVIVSKVMDPSSPHGAFIISRLAARFLISTPPAKVKAEIPQFLFLLLFAIVGLIAAVLVVYFKKRKGVVHKNKAAVFYFKKKDRVIKKGREP